MILILCRQFHLKQKAIEAKVRRKGRLHVLCICVLDIAAVDHAVLSGHHSYGDLTS